MALAVALLCVAQPARAESGPRLLPELSVEREPSPMRWMALELAVGAGAAAVTVPVALLAGAGVGSLSSNLVLAAVPALLLVLALPPVAVAAAEAWLGDRLAPGRGRFRPAVWVALGVQALMMGAAIALGANARDWRDVVWLTLAEAVALPVAVTLTTSLSRPAMPPPGMEPPLPVREARLSQGPRVPLLALSF